jgi:hypothetical protein
VKVALARGFRLATFCIQHQFTTGDADMDSEIANEILEELTSALQRLETQSAGLLEFVKEKGIAKEDDLAPYLERAGAASAVRWRATRVRMARLFESAQKKAEQAADRDTAAAPQKEQEPEKPAPRDQRSQDDRSMKRPQSLATGSAEGKAEDGSPHHVEERGGKQAPDDPDGHSEKPASKGSTRQLNAEGKAIEPTQPKSSHQQSGDKHSDHSAGSGRQSPGDAPQTEKGHNRKDRDLQTNDRNAA